MIVQCGFPRAGSTLLYLMMKSSVSNFGFFERETKATKVLSDTNIVTKRPMDIFDYVKIISKYPDTKFIINIRDPRAVLASIHANSEGRYKVNWDYSLFTSTSGVLPGKTKGLIDYLNIIYDVPNAIFVYYEKLIKDPEKEQNRLGKFCGFRYEDSFLNFHKHNVPKLLSHQLNGIRPVEGSTVDKWKLHPQRIKQQFEECPQLFDSLINLGYERDTKWIENL